MMRKSVQLNLNILIWHGDANLEMLLSCSRGTNYLLTKLFEPKVQSGIINFHNYKAHAAVSCGTLIEKSQNPEKNIWIENLHKGYIH